MQIYILGKLSHTQTHATHTLTTIIYKDDNNYNDKNNNINLCVMYGR